AFQEAVADVLVAKSLAAMRTTGLDRLVVAGGVGANVRLRSVLDAAASRGKFSVFYPALGFCTDNGAMIALAGYLRLKTDERARAGRDPRRVHAVAGGVARREKPREPPFPAVADQREKRRELLAGAQPVGRPGIARAVCARVGKRKGAAHDDGEGQRADQVGGQNKYCGGHGVPLEFAARV